MEGTIKKLTDKGFGFITVDGEEKDLFFHKNELHGVTYEELKENLSQRGRFQAAVGFTTCSRVPSEERLNRVKVPTLILMGMKDPDFPDPKAEGKYVARETGGRLDLIEGAGHYPQTEMPEKTASIIINFLKRKGNSENIIK